MGIGDLTVPVITMWVIIQYNFAYDTVLFYINTFDALWKNTLGRIKAVRYKIYSAQLTIYGTYGIINLHWTCKSINYNKKA